MPRIAGFDPGLASTGWGIVDYDNTRLKYIAHGTIITTPETATGDRLKDIYQNISMVLNTYSPDCGAVESLFFAKNVKSAIPVAQARGILLLCCADFGIDSVEYTPIQIKRAVVGEGRAEKHQIQEMVKLLLGLPALDTTSHDADALAVAICHAHSGKNYV